MGEVILLGAENRWSCPNCDAQTVTRGERGAPTHTCAGLRGFLAPLIIDGTDCKVEANEREDYIAGDDVRLDGEGRPVMNVITTRADGSTDCMVFAPTARVGINA